MDAIGGTAHRVPLPTCWPWGQAERCGQRRTRRGSIPTSRGYWVTYAEDKGLPGRNAQMIAVSPAGQVWAYFPGEGLYVLESGSEEAGWSRVTDPCGTRLSDLATAPDGTAWVASAGSGHYPGACVAYYDSKQWVEIAADHGFSSTAALALGPSGEVAASTSQGLGIYAGGAWRLLRDGPTNSNIRSVAVTPDGDAWFGFSDSSPSTLGSGLSHFDGQTWSIILMGLR